MSIWSQAVGSGKGMSIQHKGVTVSLGKEPEPYARAPITPQPRSYSQSERVLTLSVPVSIEGKEPTHFVRVETGDYLPVWYVPDTKPAESNGNQGNKWYEGKRTHTVSIASALIGLAAIFGYVPNVSPADGWDMVQTAGLASGFRAALKGLKGLFS